MTKPTTTDAHDLPKLKQFDLISFNSEAERQFCLLVVKLLEGGEQVTPNCVIQEAAYELNISVVTAKRYLIKHTARRAMFNVVDGLVILREIPF